MGGIGKTELALQYALKHKTDYPGGLCWLHCRSGDLGIQIVKFGRSRLNLNIPDGLELPDQIGYCWENWQEGTILVIYDDVVDYEEITSYLPSVDKAQFKVLITSRKRLLEPKQRIELDVLSKEAALDLLRSLVGIERINKQIEQAKVLCEWLGYLPLGLELVGSYLVQSEDLKLQELQEELNDGRLAAEALQDIKGELRTLPGVIKAFQLSWQSLSPEAKKLGCILSLFVPSDILWDWVEEMFPQDQSRNIKNIRDKELLKFSLLKRVEEKTYKLHPLIREFFISKQGEIENIDQCKRDLCRVMIEIVKQLPETFTLSVITSVIPVIPHLQEVAEKLINWVDNEYLIWSNLILGKFYQGQSAYSESEKWYEKSIEITINRLGENHSYVATSYNNLAELYRSMGRYSEAELLFQKALKIKLEQLGENHSDVATSYNNLALLYGFTGRYSEAEPLFQKALKIKLEQLGDNHLDVATSYNNLASLYHLIGRYSDAEPLFQQALKTRLEQLGENHPSVASSYNNLAGLYHSMGRYSEAEPLFQQALKISIEKLGENHPDVSQSYNNLATLYHSMGKYSKAIVYCQQALNIAIQTLGKNHPNTLAVYTNYIILMQSPDEEILKALPEELHENYRQMKQQWESSQGQES